MEDSKSPDYREKFFLGCGFATRAIHAGEHVGQPQTASHTGAIYQTSTFVFHSAAEGAEIFSGARPGYVYTRMGNPTVLLLEAKMNALEGRDVKLTDPAVRISSLAFASGMGAISGTLLALCRSGDTLLMGAALYSATQHLAENVLAKLGVRVVEVNTANLGAVEAAVKANPTARAVFFETPSNPLLDVTDIAGVVRIVRSVNSEMKIVVDNTFATPYLQRPLEHGADAVVHSSTKYLCGHGTVVGGVMTTVSDDLKNQAYVMIKDIGSSPGPFDSWLVGLGIKTLPLRMDRHCENAAALASYLAKHPGIERVHYPGLPSHPQHLLAQRQMGGKFGGVVSFEVRGGLEAGRRLLDRIRIFTLAVSLGCVDSLIEHPASMTHASVPKAKREALGLSDGLIRISVGLENVEDLLQALDDALR